MISLLENLEIIIKGENVPTTNDPEWVTKSRLSTCFGIDVYLILHVIVGDLMQTCFDFGIECLNYDYLNWKVAALAASSLSTDYNMTVLW